MHEHMCLSDKGAIYRFATPALRIANISNHPSFAQIDTILPPKSVVLQHLVLRDRRRVRQEIGFCHNELPIGKCLVKRKLAGCTVPVTIGYFYLAVKSAKGQPGIAPASVYSNSGSKITLSKCRTPYIAVFRVPIAMCQFIASPQIPDKAVVISSQGDGVPYQSVIALVFRLPITPDGPIFRAGLCFEINDTGNGIGAILEGSCPPDDFGII